MKFFFGCLENDDRINDDKIRLFSNETTSYSCRIGNNLMKGILSSLSSFKNSLSRSTNIFSFIGDSRTG